MYDHIDFAHMSVIIQSSCDKSEQNVNTFNRLYIQANYQCNIALYSEDFFDDYDDDEDSLFSSAFR